MLVRGCWIVATERVVVRLLVPAKDVGLIMRSGGLRIARL